MCVVSSSWPTQVYSGFNYSVYSLMNAQKYFQTNVYFTLF